MKKILSVDNIPNLINKFKDIFATKASLSTYAKKTDLPLVIPMPNVVQRTTTGFRISTDEQERIYNLIFGHNIPRGNTTQLMADIRSLNGRDVRLGAFQDNDGYVFTGFGLYADASYDGDSAGFFFCPTYHGSDPQYIFPLYEF